MKKLIYDVVVVGAGAAGMAAAISASKKGVKTLLIERENRVGGVLNQCIHNGFGVHYFKKDYTGPEYREKLYEKLKGTDVKLLEDTFIVEASEKEKKLIAINKEGIFEIEAKSVVAALGARERGFGNLSIPGDRVSGIFTAGVVQRLINMENLLPAKRALILGSGDIGLIMARRLHLEGVDVVGVVEIMPYPGGLERNIQQCLRDFNIPLLLSHTVTRVEGKGRLEKVYVSKVDENLKPIPGSEIIFDVDTLVLSVGLIPMYKPFGFIKRDRGIVISNTNITSSDWIFAAGNCTGIYDLVDFVTVEGEKAGEFAALKVKGEYKLKKMVRVKKGKNVNIIMPQYIDNEFPTTFYIRVSKPMKKARVIIEKLGISRTFVKVRPSEMITLNVKPFDYMESIEVKVDEL